MELYQLSLKELIEGLKNKKFTQKEILVSFYTRIQKINPFVNAFLTITGENSWNDKEGELSGIPIGFKDIYVTKDIKTTAGSKVLENYIPQYNSTVVQKLVNKGATIFGKTNQDAWAHGSSGENSDFAPAKNPWNTDYVPGGSSSGSAVAVAASMCPVAFGTDTGGSIRLPASFCNVVGLKPTYGRVSRYGIIAMASSHDSIGHFTRTVYDNALILNMTAGKDPFDATTSNIKAPDYTKNIKKGVKGLKIGLPKEYLEKGIDPEVEKIFRQVLQKYEDLGAEIINVSLPHTEYALAVYYIIQPSEVSSNLGRYDGIRFGNGRNCFGQEAIRRIMLGTYTLSAGYYDAYYLKAMKVRTLLIQDFNKAFKKVDVIITPVSPTLPFKFGEKTDNPLAMYLSDIFTVTMNLAGVPALSIPGGFAKGLPVGFQIVGPNFSEDMLYQVGYAYEQMTDWYKQKPKL